MIYLGHLTFHTTVANIWLVRANWSYIMLVELYIFQDLCEHLAWNCLWLSTLNDWFTTIFRISSMQRNKTPQESMFISLMDHCVHLAFVLFFQKILRFLGEIAEYSPHPLVLQKTGLTQTKTLTLMSVNKTWTKV